MCQKTCMKMRGRVFILLCNYLINDFDPLSIINQFDQQYHPAKKGGLCNKYTQRGFS